jgi:hypothetical protein
MRVRAGGQKQRNAIMRGISQVGHQFPARPEDGRANRQFANLRDNGKVADQFAAATEIARGTDTNDVGPCFSKVLFGGFQKLGRPVHVPAALRRTLHLDAAQNLGLQ